MFFTREVESPLRYSNHLPAGITANSLDEVAEKLEREVGVRGVAGRVGDLDEIHYHLEDRDIRLYRQGGVYVAIRSAPTKPVQAFFRPCSGVAGPLTGTGTASGLVFGATGLYALALARAHQSFWMLLPMACGVCAGCICLPLGPFPSGVSITGAGFLRITVTVDVSANILCI
jgi:hypothetical protein